MRNSMLLFAAAALLAGPVQAQGAGPTAGVSAKGDGLWEILCEYVADGELKTAILDASVTGFASPKLARMECRYRASANGDLTISVVGAESCPFAGAPAGACNLTVPKSGRGRLKFTVAKTR